MLEQKLKEIGLSDKEILVYLCVLQYQKISPASVAGITSIQRPTVYSVAKELITKNLIREDNTGNTKYLISLGEDAIWSLVKIQEAKIANTKNKIPEIISILKQIPKQGRYSIPKIRFIEEARLKEFLISQSVVWAESGARTDGAWWGFQDHTLLEKYEDWADYYWSHFSGQTVLNLFTNKKSIETKVMKKKTYATQRHIKYWNKATEFTSTHAVVGDYVLMIMTREHPHYLVEIHDKEIAQNTRNLFKSLWELI